MDNIALVLRDADRREFYADNANTSLEHYIIMYVVNAIIMTIFSVFLDLILL